MSYQVIALKWRPKTFDRMIGQNHIGQTLVNALKNGRLPQALLFTGPRGTGKTSSARILAKSLRCLNAVDYIPCGKCSECIDITSGRSLDVVEIDGASNNGVDSIRELRDSVSFRPTIGSKKVYIIDEVHMLSLSAFNALLKTLEEPPDHVIFILATTEVHKIPKTILSRCHRFDFRKVATKDLADHLEFICTQEAVPFEKEALWAIARQGEGSVRDSFSFLDQVITFTAGRVTYDSVIEALGLTDRRLLTTILSDIVRTAPEDLLSHMEDIFKTGTDVGVFAEDFLEQIKNLLIVKSTAKAKDFIDLPETELHILRQISQDISEGQIHLIFDMMLETTQNLMRTQDQRTVLEVGLLKLCLYPKVLDTQPLTGQTEKPLSVAPPKERRQSDPPSVTPEIKAEAVKASVSSNSDEKAVSSYSDEKNESYGLTEEQKKWHDFVAKVNRLNAKMGAVLQNCLYDLKGTSVWVGASEKMLFIKKDLEKPDFQKVLTNYIRTFLGPDYVLKIAAQASSTSATKVKISENSFNTKDNTFEDSFVQRMDETVNPDRGEMFNDQPHVANDKTAIKEQEDMTAEEKRRLIEKIHNSEAVQKLKQTFKEIEIVAIKEMKS